MLVRGWTVIEQSEKWNNEADFAYLFIIYSEKIGVDSSFSRDPLHHFVHVVNMRNAAIKVTVSWRWKVFCKPLKIGQISGPASHRHPHCRLVYICVIHIFISFHLLIQQYHWWVIQEYGENQSNIVHVTRSSHVLVVIFNNIDTLFANISKIKQSYTLHFGFSLILNTQIWIS